MGTAEKLLRDPEKGVAETGNGNGAIQGSSESNNGNGVKSLVLLNNCPVCQGPVFKYDSKLGRHNSWEERNLCQCLLCGRSFRRAKDGIYRPWPPSPRIGKIKKSSKDSLCDDWDE